MALSRVSTLFIRADIVGAGGGGLADGGGVGPRE